MLFSMDLSISSTLMPENKVSLSVSRILMPRCLRYRAYKQVAVEDKTNVTHHTCLLDTEYLQAINMTRTMWTCNHNIVYTHRQTDVYQYVAYEATAVVTINFEEAKPSWVTLPRWILVVEHFTSNRSFVTINQFNSLPQHTMVNTPWR